MATSDLAVVPNKAEVAAAGDPVAMNELGLLFQNGEGVPQDYGVAHSWYTKSAALGNEDARWNLGRLYQNGWGVTRDDDVARAWFARAKACSAPSRR